LAKSFHCCCPFHGHDQVPQTFTPPNFNLCCYQFMAPYISSSSDITPPSAISRKKNTDSQFFQYVCINVKLNKNLIITDSDWNVCYKKESIITFSIFFNMWVFFSSNLGVNTIVSNLFFSFDVCYINLDVFNLKILNFEQFKIFLG